MPRHKLIVILGPTAVGKTALSLALAKHLGTEIISGDSMLVYRGFDIGSAKPSMEEQMGIPHHLIDIREPWEGYSVVDFKEEAEEVIGELDGRGKIPILAGGTGLYIKSLLEGYRFSERPADALYRQRLEELAKAHGRAYVHGMLREMDAAAAARLSANDLHRVIRALEVASLGNGSISQEKTWEEHGALVYDAYVVGLRRDRQKLYGRIDLRVDEMVSAGLFEETRELLSRGIGEDTQAMKGIGYREAVCFLRGRLTREEAIFKIKQSTRHFAKRQITWYRKMPYIHWYDVDALTEGELLSAVEEDIAGYFGRA